ncbi:MAG TPA: glycoside hydrolase family 9 protein [Steroidobacteraceae bacterium]|nr:glycoside hydrolase family 9 protein [Steroidobacteraceae bacterium]
MRKSAFALTLLFPVIVGAQSAAPALSLNDKGYFAEPGLDVMVFSDYYPDGHQTGVTIVQHGTRVAANGDLRLEAAPGQWSPMPATVKREIDRTHHTISETLSYPDPAKNHTGFNPIAYPDLQLTYHVSVSPAAGNSFKIRVDLDEPLPQKWVGRVGFNLELFPGLLFGKTFLMGAQSGIFPRQPAGPVHPSRGEIVADPLAVGDTLVVAPEERLQRLTIHSDKGQLELIDGRINFNNGWYIVRTLVPAGATRDAIEWTVTPNVVPGWHYKPVLQVSQLGYAPAQPKRLVIEQDASDDTPSPVTLYRVTPTGLEEVKRDTPQRWPGRFLRYTYLTYDFTGVTDPGMYEFGYRGERSHPFKIGDGVFGRWAWEPTIADFLPVQMCHMLVRDKYRIWHGLDHQDDALMAPPGDHFDGYSEGPDNFTRYKPYQHVPGLDAGGWHDAGDYDLRIESQMGTVWMLSKMVSEFGFYYDGTTIDEQRKLALIHVPDGKNDALQQIEHGLLSVLGGYHALGRLYRGIQEATVGQYTLLGDIATDTDGLIYDPGMKPDEKTLTRSGKLDDRFVFTENNPDRALNAAAGLAAASVALRRFDPKTSADALAAARAIMAKNYARAAIAPKVFVLSELYLASGDSTLLGKLVGLKDRIVTDIGEAGWPLGEVIGDIHDRAFRRDVDRAVRDYQEKERTAALENPYGVPYHPDIWGAGWTIETFAVHQYFFHKGWPQYTSVDAELNALEFVLGVHPGSNTESFASGVGSRSATVAYGANRADWSYIPGGVISGTALIRPDLPELKVWPYFWQQSEYVMGGGATDYMFLALAADRLYGRSGAAPVRN